MTIIYEVNLKIAQSIGTEYLSWLRRHIDQMCQQKGFLTATLYEEILPEQNISNEISYIVQYKVASLTDLQHYFDHHAATVRQEGLQRFGDQFTATRRILKPV